MKTQTSGYECFSVQTALKLIFSPSSLLRVTLAQSLHNYLVFLSLALMLHLPYFF